MPQRTKVLSNTGLLLAWLGVLAPLNVFYHEIRFSTRADGPDAASARIAEFVSFREMAREQYLILDEPDDIARLERLSRFSQAQYALAPAIVVDHRAGSGDLLVNKRSGRIPAQAQVARESTRYVLLRD